MYVKQAKCKLKQADITKTYIQLFEVVVQEDKLRVGPRDMLHHQVMAEVVMGQGWFQSETDS